MCKANHPDNTLQVKGCLVSKFMMISWKTVVQITKERAWCVAANAFKKC